MLQHNHYARNYPHVNDKLNPPASTYRICAGQDMARDIERDKRQAAERARERAIWQAEQATRDPSLPLQ